jgi:hypothetical protein
VRATGGTTHDATQPYCNSGQRKAIDDAHTSVVSLMVIGDSNGVNGVLVLMPMFVRFAATSTKARLPASQTMLVSATSRGGRVHEKNHDETQPYCNSGQRKAIDDAHTSVVSLTVIDELR